MNQRALSMLVVAVALLSLTADGVASGQIGPSGPGWPTAHLSRICTYHGHRLGNGIFFVSVSRKGETYQVYLGANRAMTVKVTLRVPRIHYKESFTRVVGRFPCYYDQELAFGATNAQALRGKHKFWPRGALLTVSYKGKIILRQVLPAWEP